MRILDITVGEGRRPIREASVLALKDSIRDVGLLHPVVVTEDGALVAGLHRMTACALLGWVEIPVTIIRGSEAVVELAELDENLMADRGTALERAVWLARRKELYLVLHPETRRGGDRKSSKIKGQLLPSDAAPFATDTAKKIGKSERTVNACVQIGSMPAETLEALKGTPIEDKHETLLALARMPPAKLAEVTAMGPSALVEAVPHKTKVPKPAPPAPMLPHKTMSRQGLKRVADPLAILTSLATDVADTWERETESDALTGRWERASAIQRETFIKSLDALMASTRRIKKGLNKDALKDES